jgi:L-amino acid N-acyltransferase YncA
MRRADGIPAGSIEVIRPARREDIAAITAIYRQAVLEETGTFEIEPPDEAEMRARYERIAAADLPYFVAEAPSGVVGYAYAAPYHHRAAYRFTLEDSVYVNRLARGKSVGLALLDALVIESARRGFRQMIALVGDSANDASLRLHERAGFARAGVLAATGWKHGRWLDVVLMQRALGSESGSPAT